MPFLAIARHHLHSIFAPSETTFRRPIHKLYNLILGMNRLHCSLSLSIHLHLIGRASDCFISYVHIFRFLFCTVFHNNDHILRAISINQMSMFVSLYLYQFILIGDCVVKIHVLFISLWFLHTILISARF